LFALFVLFVVLKYKREIIRSFIYVMILFYSRPVHLFTNYWSIRAVFRALPFQNIIFQKRRHLKASLQKSTADGKPVIADNRERFSAQLAQRQRRKKRRRAIYAIYRNVCRNSPLCTDSGFCVARTYIAEKRRNRRKSVSPDIKKGESSYKRNGDSRGGKRKPLPPSTGANSRKKELRAVFVSSPHPSQLVCWAQQTHIIQ